MIFSFLGTHLYSSFHPIAIDIQFYIDIHVIQVCWHIVDYIHHSSQSIRRCLKQNKRDNWLLFDYIVI